MKMTRAVLFLATFVAITTCVCADDAPANTNAEKPANSDLQPYLMFIQQNGDDSLMIYEQWRRKSPDQPCMLTVLRKTGGKPDIMNFGAKLEEFKDGVCRFRILGNEPIYLEVVTKAKELLGIKSDVFEIHFRDDPGQTSRTLLSVKDVQEGE